MNIKSALETLKVGSLKSMDDVEFQYQKELSKATSSYQNAFNENIKKEYAFRIEELNAAFEYINLNKHELKSKSASDTPIIEVTSTQKKLIIIAVIILISVGTFFGVRSYKASNFFNEGMTLFRSMDYESALPYFKKADDLGSLRGKYYYGKTLHRLFPHQKRFGFETMKTAVDNGVELDDMEQGEYNLLKTKSENYNKL